MTIGKAKKIIESELNRLGLPYTKLTARTVRFSSLLRDGCIFVRIHGWQKGPAWGDLKALASKHDFCIES